MSRFDAGRKLRIAVWTGAALAWGTTAAMAAQRSADQSRGPDPEPNLPATDLETVAISPLPSMPESGLVILRYQPAPEVKPEVTTIYVPAPATTRAPTASAPAPRSSGS